MAGEKLRADTKRQASDSIRGYAYQIWHSLYAWLTLEENQVLYLEGAEDFDVIEDASALAVQVKNSKKRISLRSEAAREALANYFEIRETNPGRHVRFRFLTTAATSIENGTPFGVGMAGLDFWEVARRSDEDAEVMRTFLLEDARLPSKVRRFLEACSAEEVRRELLIPFGWEAGSKSSGYVESAVSDVLVCHGDRYNVSPSEAKKTIGNLLKTTLETISRPRYDARHLTRAQFLELFHKLTTVRVPAQTLTALRTRDIPTLGLGEQVLEPLRFQDALSPVREEVPPSLADLAPRSDLIQRLRMKLQELGLLILTGSAGLGKTTLAKHLAQGVSTVLWADCATQEPAEVGRILTRLTGWLNQQPEGALIVIDDLDLSGHLLKSLEAGLGSLLYSASNRRQNVIITAQRSLPARFVRTLALQPGCEEAVPRFSLEDILELALAMGCPAKVADKWKSLVLMHSGGHPQLTHAELLGLRQKNWPHPRPEDLMETPEEVRRERSEIRAMLLRQLPEETLNFLYHLSVYFGPFRRDHAVAIGELPTVDLRQAGDVFEGVLGPWVESVGSGYYRLSALLATAGVDTWSRAKLKRVCKQLAEIILEVGNLTLREMSSLLSHSLIGAAEEALQKACVNLLLAPSQARSDIAQVLDWVAAVSTERGAVAAGALTRCCFRQVQFRIAQDLSLKRCEDIVHAWKRDVGEIPDERIAQSQRVLLATEVMTAVHASVPPSMKVKALLELEQFAQDDSQISEILAAQEETLPSSLRRDGDLLFSQFPIIAFGCKDPAEVDELLSFVDELDGETVDRLLAPYRQSRVERSIFIDHVWTNTAKEESPDWQAAIGVLRKAVTFGAERNVRSIQATAYAALAVVYSEYLNDLSSAHDWLDKAEEQLGWHPIVRNQRAVVFLEARNYESALEVWETLLPRWATDCFEPVLGTATIDRVFATRNAGICAAKVGQWGEAGHYFESGGGLAATIESTAWGPGYFADAAFCYWKALDNTRSVSCLERALQELEKLPDPDEDIDTRMLAKLIGHVLLWILTSARKGDLSELGEPTVGLCSGAKIEELAKLSITPIDLCWLLLSQLEVELLATWGVLNAREQQLTTSPLSIVRLMCRRLQLQRAFKNQSFDDLPRLAESFAEESLIAELKRAQGGDVTVPDSLHPTVELNGALDAISTLLLAALLAVQRLDDHGWAETLTKWGGCIDALKLKKVLVNWIRQARRILLGELSEAQGIMVDSSEERYRRLLAALRLSCEDRLLPELRFYAHILIFGGLADGLWDELIGADLACLVARQWRRHADSPATLRSPRITVPVIIAACSSASTGMTKVAEILLAADAAVDVNTPSSALNRLRLAASRQPSTDEVEGGAKRRS